MASTLLMLCFMSVPALQAQTGGNGTGGAGTAGGSGATTGAATGQGAYTQQASTDDRNDGGSKAGWLGLLGLLGLLGMRKRETTVRRDTTTAYEPGAARRT